MKITDFDFDLPDNFIAKRPLDNREGSRLLVLHRDGKIDHKHFSDLPSYLGKGDLLIINNTKVFPAKLTGFKKNGSKVELILVRKNDHDEWEVLSRGKFTGILTVSDELQIDLYKGSSAKFRYSGDFMNIVWKYGSMPIPPYIKRPADETDKENYQTVYAKKEGSIAAPTAGLHFTDTILNNIDSRGVSIREITLHVGVGTFTPIRTESLEEHSMDAEYFEIASDLISEIEEVKANNRKIITVGTTTTRALEGYVSGKFNNGSNPPSPVFLKENRGGPQSSGFIKGTTDIFIYPGHTFNVVDSLITNFHLPRSTPLMLACALAGKEKLLSAYREAVARRYRFLSYGDAMLIL
jgi:S-adenosylmethionine:tRNA ribosyltransferase-isomerase